MGFFDFDGASVLSGSTSHRRSSGRKSGTYRSRSADGARQGKSFTDDLAASFFGGDSYQKRNGSRSSFFGMPNASRSSFFGFSKSRRRVPPSAPFSSLHPSLLSLMHMPF